MLSPWKGWPQRPSPPDFKRGFCIVKLQRGHRRAPEFVQALADRAASARNASGAGLHSDLGSVQPERSAASVEVPSTPGLSRIIHALSCCGRTLSGLRQACSVLRACDVPPVRLGAKLLRAPASAPTSCASRRRSHAPQPLCASTRAATGEASSAAATKDDSRGPALASCLERRSQGALGDAADPDRRGNGRAQPHEIQRRAQPSGRSPLA
jgi:hypothetical protein